MQVKGCYCEIVMVTKGLLFFCPVLVVHRIVYVCLSMGCKLLFPKRVWLARKYYIKMISDPDYVKVGAVCVVG